MKFLLDTCIISEMVKPIPDARVMHWLDDQDEEGLYLTVITIGELHRGISKLDDSKKKGKLQHWVERELYARFGGRLLSVDLDVARIWGNLQGESEKQGTKLPAIDSLIAATALAHQLVVATRNDRDLLRCRVQIFNPWVA